jgi:hypothetical protein
MIRQQDGQWNDVRIVKRDGQRTEIVHLQPQNRFRESLPPDQVALVLSDADGLKKATVDGKYTGLLHVVRVENDFHGYGAFRDSGYWGGSSYAGYRNLNPGHWVYVFPNWYVWKEKK